MSIKTNSLYGMWGTVVLFTTLYAAITIPFRLAFKLNLTSFGVADWLISLVFLLDFIIHFGKFRKKQGNKEVQDFEEKEWYQVVLLLTDLMAALPLALFLSPFFHLCRLFKILRIHDSFRSYSHRVLEYAGTYTLFSFVFWIIIAISALACGWHALGVHDETSNLTTQYIDALYWTITTLTTVGYGDITPVTNLQKLYAIFVEILGFGVITFAIGTVASRLMRKNHATARYQENIDSLAALMDYRSLPLELRDRIVSFYRYMWRKRLGYDETTFLQSLPESLRIEVALHLKQEVIEKVSLFHNASENFKREIALLLKPKFFAPGDYIFKAGDSGKEMYFVVHGDLDTLTQAEDQVITRLEPGDFFGEIALFKNQNRSATIKALSFCDLYALDKSSFNRVISRYPAIGKQIKETVELREKKYSV